MQEKEKEKEEETKKVTFKDITVRQIEQELKKQIADLTGDTDNGVYISSFLVSGPYELNISIGINDLSW